MSNDYIKLKRGFDSGQYILEIYFSEVDKTINVQFTDRNLILLIHEAVKIINQSSDEFTLKMPDNIYSLLDDEELSNIITISKSFTEQNTIKNKGSEVEVFIYIPDRHVDVFTSESITNSAGDFMEALGFQLETEDEPIYSSFLKRLKFIFSKKVSKEDLEEIFSKGKKALELKYVELPSAEQTEKLANAASKLVDSLANCREGVIRCGALLVLKKYVNGETQIFIHQLSTELIIMLDKYPKLAMSTETIYNLLQNMNIEKDDLEDESEALIA